MSLLKLIPSFKDYLWGGTKLKEKYNKNTNVSPCAESWELSMHCDGPSYVGDKKLSDVVTDEMLGENVAALSEFPMLIKFIDAKENLSVQVHPSDVYAKKYENSLGKTEMWYIVEASENAGIYLGFKKKLTKDEFLDAINNNTLTELLRFYPVKAGECYFIPSGTVHAIGAGCLICEIQQNSNLTYRVYDYGRIGKDGRARELHIDKAIAVSNLGEYELRTLPDSVIGISKYFTARKLTVNKKTVVPMDKASFRCVCVVRGRGSVNCATANLGDSFFVGADEEKITLSGDMDVIITELRRYRVSTKLTKYGCTATLIDDTGAEIAAKFASDAKSAVQELLSSLCLTENDI